MSETKNGEQTRMAPFEDEVGGPEQVRHLTAPSESALLACLEALLPSSVDARSLIDIGAVYIDRVR